MIDIVIPLGKGSQWENNELRYSLRSLEKFGRNVGKVFVVGEMPKFIKASARINGWSGQVFENTVTYIPHVDKYGHERNIMEKVLAACKDERVSDNFLFWNDDFFLTDFIDCENYPNYYHGTLEQRASERLKSDGYGISIRNTLDVFKDSNQIFFDIHCPIVYNKGQFLNSVPLLDWTKGNGYIIKSLYANTWFENSDIYFEMPDLKFNKVISKTEIRAKLEGRHIFSVADSGLFRDMKETIKELYPIPSQYEQ